MTEKPFRYTFDREGHVRQPKATPAAREPKPRRGNNRKYVTDQTELILNRCYPGEVPAAVIERALRQMVKHDGKQLPGRRQP